MAEGTNNNKTDRWLDMSNSYVWSATWFVTDYWHQGGSVNCLSTLYNESHNGFQQLRWYIAAYCVGDQPKQYQPQYFLTFSDGPIMLFHYHRVSVAFWISRIWFGEAGRRAQSWLVTCSSSDNTLSIWAPSSRLSFKRRLLMGRRPEESCGISKEILNRNRCTESTLKHK